MCVRTHKYVAMLRKLLLSALLIFAGIVLRSQTVSVDPSAVIGPVKVMNAVNNVPLKEYQESFKALRIPYSRLHDSVYTPEYGGPNVDITDIFPDFDADVDDPASYDFAVTDSLLLRLVAVGTEPYYRLGQSIVTYEDRSRVNTIIPPKDFKKWAEICDHVIRHYNEGWADGYHMGITHWEIWNEADLDQVKRAWKKLPRCWAGPRRQFFKLYVTTAKLLKERHPDLKIGGPSYANTRKYGRKFLRYVKRHHAPLDFYSWHMYHRKPWRIIEDAGIIRGILDRRGFTSTESHLNEWNYHRSWADTTSYSDSIRADIKGAAFISAVMCEGQKGPVDMLMYYDIRPNVTWNGAYATDTYAIQPQYWSLYYWSDLLEYGTEVSSGCDNENIYTCAARSSDGKVRILIVRYHNDDKVTSTREVTLGIPDGWKVSSISITDGSEMNRRPEPSTSIVLESNAMALVEMEQTNN